MRIIVIYGNVVFCVKDFVMVFVKFYRMLYVNVKSNTCYTLKTNCSYSKFFVIFRIQNGRVLRLLRAGEGMRP